MPLLQALQAAMRSVIDHYADQRDRLRMRHQVIASSPSLRTRTAERQQRLESDVVERVRVSGRAGDMDDLELRLLVASTTTALRVAVETWVAADTDRALVDLLDVAFQRLCVGFRP